MPRTAIARTRERRLRKQRRQQPRVSGQAAIMRTTSKSHLAVVMVVVVMATTKAVVPEELETGRILLAEAIMAATMGATTGLAILRKAKRRRKRALGR